MSKPIPHASPARSGWRGFGAVLGLLPMAHALWLMVTRSMFHLGVLMPLLLGAATVALALGWRRWQH